MCSSNENRHATALDMAAYAEFLRKQDQADLAENTQLELEESLSCLVALWGWPI